MNDEANHPQANFTVAVVRHSFEYFKLKGDVLHGKIVLYFVHIMLYKTNDKKGTNKEHFDMIF